MQLDMHYYGTYAMARAAGLKKEASRIIATAAQFIDDNAGKESVDFRDGGRMDVEATAHHAYQIKNIDKEDQRQIWVPFHFLPGNEGDSYTARLACRKDSAIAKEMVKFNLSLCDQPYALPLIGITAHVYADTFSHYGFSGVSSRKNKIVNDSFHFVELESGMEGYIRDKERKFRENYPGEYFMDNIKSWVAETLSGALGHGAAVTFPDRPFLKWNFKYEETKERCPLRDNPQTFLDACEALHAMFREFARKRPDFAENNSYKEFPSIKDLVVDILNTQADKKGRIQLWKDAALGGELFGTGSEKIPFYNEDTWHNQRDNLKEKEDSSTAIDSDIYRFYQAASIHRVNVLRSLLPSHRLVVA